VVGRVTSGGYGYTVERSIAFAYVPAATAAPGQEPLWDPSGARIRA
jgi:4-methylaminobutanoate oxidase (formaldehyde-forming)